MRVHGGELAQAANDSASIFAKGRGADARALATLAGTVGTHLDQVTHSQSDPARLRTLAGELQRAAGRAAALGKRL